MFPALQLSGAIRYTGRPAHLLALMLVGIGLGALRAMSLATDHSPISDGLSLAFEPTAMFASAFLVHRTATREHGHWPHRRMPVALAAVGVVECIGAVQGLLFSERGLLWRAWLAAAVPLATLQVIARMDTEERSRCEVAHAQAARERSCRPTFQRRAAS